MTHTDEHTPPRTDTAGVTALEEALTHHVPCSIEQCNTAATWRGRSTCDLGCPWLPVCDAHRIDAINAHAAIPPDGLVQCVKHRAPVTFPFIEWRLL